jgi:hypothetical protein
VQVFASVFRDHPVFLLNHTHNTTDEYETVLQHAPPGGLLDGIFTDEPQQLLQLLESYRMSEEALAPLDVRGPPAAQRCRFRDADAASSGSKDEL